MADLILREWAGKRIRIREDRYVRLTDMAKASGKNMADFFRLDKTKSYLEALSLNLGFPVMTDTKGIQALVEVKKGGKVDESGTWGHPKVAIRFAQWCSDDFAIQVDSWIDELLSTGSVLLEPNEKMYTIDMVVRRTPATWERMFSASWIEQAELLTKWKWEWSCMGTFINDTIYAYLPLDVVNAIKELNPKVEDGRGRIHKHHQFLEPEFREIVLKHINEVELLMRAAKNNMDLFKLLMVNNFGRFKLSGGDELPLFKTQTVFIVQAS
jgi:KilA-N domain/P63C domain